MERLGREPDPNKAPIEDYHFPLEVQQAFLIHRMLSDQWDGMSGSYMGKDWAPITVFLDTYNIEDKVDVLYFIKVIDQLYTAKLNTKLEKERKTREKKSQVGIKTPKVQ